MLPVSACESTGTILAAEYIPSLLQLMALDARTSIGNRESDPPFNFSRFLGGFPDSRFPTHRIPSPGNGNRETGRFPIRPGTGNRGPNSASRGFPGLGGAAAPPGPSPT
jgi:hypothetical protein